MNIDFTVTFRGGRGKANIEIDQAGFKIGSHTFDTSDTWTTNLPGGLYTVQLNGVSPPDGTTFKISSSTDPSTPVSFAEGPFEDLYTMNLNAAQV